MWQVEVSPVKERPKPEEEFIAYDFFYKAPDAPEMRELEDVPRDAWIPGESMMDSITEQSRPLTYYDSVLTVLWIRE